MAVKIALAGNPNCGKTTLFNALTGSNQFVGNWPGVTVEKKEGKLKGHKDVTIMDLPGIYSLSPYTLEEVVARNYLIGERPDAIINIVDGTNIERNLYLSTQIMELGIPVIMAVNMVDILEKTGEKVHIDKLSQKLGCEVVEISALKGTGITKAAEKAVALAQQKGAVTPVHEFSKEVEDVIREVEAKLGSSVDEAQKRFFAIKLLERDDKIGGQIKSIPDVSAEIKKLEEAFDDDTESIITNERYVYISSIIGECVTKPKNSQKLVLRYLTYNFSFFDQESNSISACNTDICFLGLSRAIYHTAHNCYFNIQWNILNHSLYLVGKADQIDPGTSAGRT